MTDAAPVDLAGMQQVAIDVDLDGPFTIGEIIAIEEMSGEQVGPRSGLYLRAVALVVGRRANPDLTAEDVEAIEVAFGG